MPSYGYDGTLDEVAFAKAVMNGGTPYSVSHGADFYAQIGGTGDRAITLYGGEATGKGVRVVLPDSVQNLPATSTGSRWHLLALRRNWNDNTATIVKIAGNATPSIPARQVADAEPWIMDDQPLWLARVDAGKTAVQELIDLRVWTGPGGASANHELVLSYLTMPGAQIAIGDNLWVRTYTEVGGDAIWRKSSMIGSLIGVHRLNWLGVVQSGSSPQGTSIWSQSSQAIARFALPSPGVPYRVQFYADGFWGDELGSNGVYDRYDFDVMVGSTVVATRIPPADDFYYGNWRSWTTHPSEQVFTGPANLDFRARRVGGSPYGAVKPLESKVIASIWSAST